MLLFYHLIIGIHFLWINCLTRCNENGLTGRMILENRCLIGLLDFNLFLRMNNIRMELEHFIYKVNLSDPEFELNHGLLNECEVWRLLSDVYFITLCSRDVSLFLSNGTTPHLVADLKHRPRNFEVHGQFKEFRCISGSDYHGLLKCEVMIIMPSSVSFVSLCSRDVSLFHSISIGTTPHLMTESQHGSPSEDHGQHQDFVFHRPRLKILVMR